MHHFFGVLICSPTGPYRYCDHEKGCSSNTGGSTKIEDFTFENISGSLANHKGVYSLRSSSYS